MAVDFHVHRALVHQPHPAAIGSDRPGTIQLVPRTFVAIQEKVGIDRVELQMVQVAVLEAGLA